MMSKLKTLFKTLQMRFVPGLLEETPSVLLYDYDTLCKTSENVEIPETFMLNPEEIPDCRNQKTTGQCAAFTTAGILQILWFKETGERIQFSTTYPYGRHRKKSERNIEGMFPFQLVKRLCSLGSIPNELMPELVDVPNAYDLVHNHQYLDKLDEIAEKSKIDTYVSFCWADESRRAREMKEAILKYRVPLFANIEISGGNHAVPIIGWDKNKWYYMNSWGESVGDKGICSVKDKRLSYAILLLDAKNTPPFPFTDVSDEHWASKAIKRCFGAGLINGVDETHFMPAKLLTRAQICQVLYKLAQKYANINGKEFVDVKTNVNYNDVPREHWAYNAVKYCYGKKVYVVYGVNFMPDETLRRDEFCGIICNFVKEHCSAKKLKNIETKDISFVDVDKNNVYYDAICKCYSLGLINGVDETHFAPETCLTRAHLCQIIYKLIKVIEDYEA